MVPVPAPVPVHAPSPDAALSAAMAEVKAFARDKIQQRAFWHYFTADANGQRSRGMWQSLRRGGPQALLLEVFPSIDPPTFWVPRPTGVIVLDGRYRARKETSQPAWYVRAREEKDAVVAPIRFSMSAEGDSCSLLITRLPLFPNTPPDRVMAHTLGRMDREQATAFHDKMERLLTR